MHRAISKLITETEHEGAEFQAQVRERETQRKLRKERKLTELLPNLTPARAKDYRRWLKGFLGNGGKPTHYYDHNMTSGDWFVATKALTLFPLFGSTQVNIIVPAGVEVTIEGGFSHNNLFFMDGFIHEGHWIPVFADTVV